MTTDPVAALNAMLDAGDPENWIFSEHGARVIGQVMGQSKGTTKHGPVPILILNVNGVPRSVWLMHTALRNEVKRMADEGELNFGDYIGIEYKGKKPTKAGDNEYDAYDVRVIPMGESSGLASFGSGEAAGELGAGSDVAEVVDASYEPPPGWGE